jgi:hypothetical protein
MTLWDGNLQLVICFGLVLKFDNFLMYKILGQWLNLLFMKTFGVVENGE